MHVLDCAKTELKRRELVNKLHRGRFRLWQESRRFAQTSCPKVSERLVWHSKLDQLPRTFPLGYLLRQCPLRTVTADGPLNCDTASGPARLVPRCSDAGCRRLTMSCTWGRDQCDDAPSSSPLLPRCPDLLPSAGAGRNRHPLRETLMQQTGATATGYAVAIDQQGDKPGQELDSGGLFA